MLAGGIPGHVNYSLQLRGPSANLPLQHLEDDPQFSGTPAAEYRSRRRDIGDRSPMPERIEQAEGFFNIIGADVRPGAIGVLFGAQSVWQVVLQIGQR